MCNQTDATMRLIQQTWSNGGSMQHMLYIPICTAILVAPWVWVKEWFMGHSHDKIYRPRVQLRLKSLPWVMYCHKWCGHVIFWKHKDTSCLTLLCIKTIKVLSYWRNMVKHQAAKDPGTSISVTSLCDQIHNKELSVVYCPTLQMLADHFTKPLQGSQFQILRNRTRNYNPD